MAQSKKNGGRNRKGEKTSHPHLSQKNKVIAVLLIILAISAFSSWWLMRDDSSQNGDYPPNIDRSITFPKDEGRHNESMELWSVNFHLITESEKIYEVYIRYANIGGKEICITDEGNVSGNTFYSKSTEGTFDSEYGRLNLTFFGGGESDNWYQIEDTSFSYRLHSEMNVGNEEFAYIDVEMISIKNPILIGEKGKIFLWEYGTIFGYIQSRLTVQGTLRVGENIELVQGDCWIEHNWGGWRLHNQEMWTIQLDDSNELAIFRMFSPVTQEVFYDYFYLIDEVSDLEEVESGNYTIEVLQYWRDPTDSLQKRCYSSKWRVFSQEYDIDLVITPLMDDQLTLAYWGGSCTVSGEIEGRTVNGFCYAQLNHFYRTTLSINEVWHILDPEIPTYPSNVSANITDDIPVANATLVYNINGGENHSIAMINVEGDIWEGVIPGQPFGSIINYYVMAFDLSGNSKKSDVYSSEVS